MWSAVCSICLKNTNSDVPARSDSKAWVNCLPWAWNSWCFVLKQAVIANKEIHVTSVCDLILFIYFFCHMLFIVSIYKSLERYYGNFKIQQPLLNSMVVMQWQCDSEIFIKMWTTICYIILLQSAVVCVFVLGTTVSPAQTGQTWMKCCLVADSCEP